MSVRLALATASPTPGTTSRVISGPNPKLAMLRALALRAAFLTQQSWHAIKAAGRSLAKAPGWMGQVVLSVLSTPAGYTSAVTLISTGVRLAMRGADVGIRAVGRLAAIATGAACAGIGSVVPAWRGALIAAHADTVDRINHAYERAAATVTRLGEQVRVAADTRLVQSVATRAAAAASALLVLHVITKGAIALHLVQLVPAAAAVVAWVTSPWLSLLGVGGATGAALVHALWTGSRADLDDVDVTVEIAADGSVMVHGLPPGAAPELRDDIAQQAASAFIHDMQKGAPRKSVVGNVHHGMYPRRTR